MAKPPSAAQRRAVTGSDPATGRLSARPDVCMALAAAGLAVPHGRGGHHAYYLTTEGLRLRAELAAAARGPVESERAGTGGSGTGGSGTTGSGTAGSGTAGSGPAVGAAFTADDGTGQGPPPGGAARRAAEVASAWEGLLQIRAVLLDGVTDVPAPWERERCVHAVSLALEAAGCPPARPDSPEPMGPEPMGDARPAADQPPPAPASAGSAGYRVTPATEPGMARVDWSDPASAAAALTECARLLGARGWQPTEHRTRDGHPYLVVSPRR